MQETQAESLKQALIKNTLPLRRIKINNTNRRDIMAMHEIDYLLKDST